MSYDRSLKCIIIGDACVGKSCLLVRYTDNHFVPMNSPTIGIEFGVKYLNVDGQVIKLQIWDTAGQESFRSIVRPYYREAAVVLLVYDMTKRKTYEHLSFWLNEARQMTNDCDLAPVIMLVGNKCEDETNRQVSREEAQCFAKLYDLLFLEASAKEGINVEEIFAKPTTLAYQLWQNKPKKPIHKKIITKEEKCC